jgi:DNA repair protein RadC
MEVINSLGEVEIIYKSKKPAINRRNISSSSDSYNIAKDIYSDNMLESYESFRVLMLNNANHFLGWFEASRGGINATIVDVRRIAQAILLSNATSCILMHNHPTGNLKPSEADKITTTKVIKGLKLLDIQVLDHLIITLSGYYSFSDDGIL